MNCFLYTRHTCNQVKNIMRRRFLYCFKNYRESRANRRRPSSNLCLKGTESHRAIKNCILFQKEIFILEYSLSLHRIANDLCKDFSQEILNKCLLNCKNHLNSLNLLRRLCHSKDSKRNFQCFHIV
jgi:hypothetical protein